MKKLKFISGILLILLVTTAVNMHAQTKQSKSLEKARAQIEKSNSIMIDAMLKGDYNATLGLYTEDAYSLPSYSPMMYGVEAIKKSGEEMSNTPMKITSFELKIKEIIPRGDVFVEVGNYKMSTDVEGMPEPFKDHGKYVTIWEKQDDGSLKIMVETWNSNVNPWAQGG